MLFPYCLSKTVYFFTISTTAKFKACPKQCVKNTFGFRKKFIGNKNVFYNCNKSICLNVINIVNSNEVLMVIKSFINPSERKNKVLLITTICHFIGHCLVQYAIVNIFFASLNIIKVNNFMIAFCVS